MKPHRALIIGGTGQDGIYLYNFLKTLGYELLSTQNSNLINSKQLSLLKLEEPKFFKLNLTEKSRIEDILRFFKPNQVYNFAAQSSVNKSFIYPEETFKSNLDGFLNLILSVKKVDPHIKIFQSSSSEMFGEHRGKPFNEKDSFYPLSPYGISKSAAHVIANYFREKFQLRIYCGILFNHDSELRSENFVTKKIVSSFVKIKLGLLKTITLGNINISRDWGYAAEYVEAIHSQLQLDNPTDLIIGTGQTNSLTEFLIEVMTQLNLGTNVADYVEISSELSRKTDIIYNSADLSQSKLLLNWTPKYKMENLIEKMLSFEFKMLRRQ